MNDQLGKGRVKRPIREGQSLSGRPEHLCAGVAFPSSGDEGLRGVDGRHGRSPKTGDQLGRECPGTAADIEGPLAGSHTGEVRQLRG